MVRVCLLSDIALAPRNSCELTYSLYIGIKWYLPIMSETDEYLSWVSADDNNDSRKRKKKN